MRVLIRSISTKSASYIESYVFYEFSLFIHIYI
jgi:hypothetical protein